MKLEAGKDYVRRGGGIGKCAWVSDNPRHEAVAAMVVFTDPDGTQIPMFYCINGMFYDSGTPSENDLLREHREARRIKVTFERAPGGLVGGVDFGDDGYQDGETVTFVEEVK